MFLWNWVWSWMKKKTVEEIIAPIYKFINDLEAQAAAKIAEAENHLKQITHYEALKADAEEELAKARRFAEKVRKIFEED